MIPQLLASGAHVLQDPLLPPAKGCALAALWRYHPNLMSKETEALPFAAIDKHLKKKPFIQNQLWRVFPVAQVITAINKCVV